MSCTWDFGREGRADPRLGRPGAARLLPIVRDQIRFALIDRTEIERAVLVRWLIVHIVLGVGAIAGTVLLMTAVRQHRHLQTWSVWTPVPRSTTWTAAPSAHRGC